MRRFLAVAVVSTAFIAAVAQAALLKPDAMIKARQGMMEAVSLQVSNLADVAKGTTPLSPAAAEAAANVAGLAHALKTTYVPGTESLPGSNAKPAAFTNSKDFLAGYDRLADQAGKIEAAAKAGNMDDFKKEFQALGQVCGACHKNFRNSNS